MSERVDSAPDVLVVLSAEDLHKAILEYVGKEHPDLAGRPAVVTFDHVPPTTDDAGVRVRARIAVDDASG